MRQGEKGEPVAIVQQALIDLGFAMPRSTNNGRSLTDGIFGTETSKVVTQFQSRFGLVADGVVGRQTMARLDDLIMSQSNLEEAESFTIAREEFSLRTAKPVS